MYSWQATVCLDVQKQIKSNASLAQQGNREREAAGDTKHGQLDDHAVTVLVFGAVCHASS